MIEMLVVAGLVMLKDWGETLATRQFPDGPWWKLLAVEAALIVPVLALVFALVPEDADPSVAGLLAGVVLGSAASALARYLVRRNK